MSDIKIVQANENNITDFGLCGYKNIKREGYAEKIEWFKKRSTEGLCVKILLSEQDGPQGMIEYIPGKFCWRPVDAADTMFIHCIFTGYKKEYKGKGYGTLLLQDCINDAKQQKLSGVSVVTRKSSFMADSKFFLKNGFEIVEKAKPDFELLQLKFNEQVPTAKFTIDPIKSLEPYSQGLSIIRADQCPYSVKNVREICETTKKQFKIEANVVNLTTYQEAQKSPSPFGSFCIIYNGKIVSYHPISNTRFVNIMKKELK